MATALASIGERLLTAEEYAELSLPVRTELVRGKVVEVNQPRPRHGLFCRNVIRALDGFVAKHDLGYVFPNDTGFLTRRGPDTVRGPDVCFYSYARMPKGQVPETYTDVAPEIVFEVVSPSDRWRDVLEKVVEYLDAGVLAVCVLDPEQESAHVNTVQKVGEVLSGDDSLTFEEILPGFSVRVSDLFAT
jgi:Uma2 family endonuclease